MMENNNGVVTETLPTGYVKRFFLQELTISASSDRRLSQGSQVTFFNSALILSAEGEDIGASPERAPSVTITVGEMLTKLGVTYEQFVEKVWADTMMEQLND